MDDSMKMAFNIHQAGSLIEGGGTIYTEEDGKANLGARRWVRARE